MMVVLLGGLQSISPEYYDAAQIDGGASGWQQFKSITMPLLKPVLVPATVLGGSSGHLIISTSFTLLREGGPHGRNGYFGNVAL